MYKLQLSCIVILICIVSVNALTRQRKSNTHKWYLILAICSIIQIALDAMSVYTVNHLDTVNPLVNRIVHFFFLAMLLTVFFCMYMYALALIEEELGNKLEADWWVIALLVLGDLIILILPLYYIETPKGNYSTGPAVYMLYVSVAVFLAATIYQLFRNWKLLPNKKKLTISVSITSVLCVSVYQAFVPTALISCLGITLINMGVYVTVENPDAVLVQLLKEETSRADAANRAKSTFLANMSHEIRTPINAVLGMNEMILRETKEENVKHYAADIQSAARSLLGIINDILDITKVESGKLSILPEEYDFCSLIHDVVNMISYRANMKNLEFKVLIDERIPGKLMGDDIRIRQILINMLNNAVKYTHTGTVTLRVNFVEVVEDKVELYFEVMDTGIGIKPEDMEALYVPFQRIEEKRNRNIEGTGLGINITIELLEMMGSRLEVQSTYGQGSVFSFNLSQGIVDATPVGDFEARLIDTANMEAHQTQFEAPGAKILIVDDNAMNRRVFQALLKGTGIHITEAASGRECIEYVQQERFDIIFMDHMMPELDGVETLKIMKTMEELPCKDAPVVMLTANAVVGAKEQYLAEGFKAFLSKPINPEKLENLIVELLDSGLVKGVSETQAIQEPEKTIELPIIEGVDWGFARLHFRDDESMLEMVQAFYSVLEKEILELDSYYANIQDEESRKLFQIKVHSMKNTAATVGIVTLAGLAKILEEEARDWHKDTLATLYPVFRQRWLAYTELLEEFRPERQESIPVEGHEEEIRLLLNDIRQAAQQLDMDGIDEAVALLKRYQFQGTMKDDMEKIFAAAWDFDVGYLTGMEM